MLWLSTGCCIYRPVVDPVGGEDVHDVAALGCDGGVQQRGDGHEYGAAGVLHPGPVLHDDLVALGALPHRTAVQFSSALCGSAVLAFDRAVNPCKHSLQAERMQVYQVHNPLPSTADMTHARHSPGQRRLRARPGGWTGTRATSCSAPGTAAPTWAAPVVASAPRRCPTAWHLTPLSSP